MRREDALLLVHDIMAVANAHIVTNNVSEARVRQVVSVWRGKAEEDDLQAANVFETGTPLRMFHKPAPRQSRDKHVHQHVSRGLLRGGPLPRMHAHHECTPAHMHASVHTFHAAGLVRLLAKPPSLHADFWDQIVAPAVGCRGMMVRVALQDACSLAG
jgi:hypothetical protein